WQTRPGALKETQTDTRQQTPDADGKNPPNIQHTVEFSKDNHTTVQADPQGQTFRKATFLA
ncbi:hypothetical protein, partial [Actinomycetospora callitridis]|uniref:hypothetical protein n=1 Tax=Actinomycetospora callitridis TaxID=913944 RepID=UPI0023667242